jgi:hypothetical protein
MDKYYYLVSQLPSLFFDRPASIRLADFLQEAEKWLSRRARSILSRVDFNDTALDGKVPQVLRDYKAFETDLRMDLAGWRKSQQDGGEYRPEHFPLSVVTEGTPLDVEKRLLRLRWDFIESLEGEHHFDLGFLVLYCLKLQILRRLSTFNREKGVEVFQEICKVAYE